MKIKNQELLLSIGIVIVFEWVACWMFFWIIYGTINYRPRQIPMFVYKTETTDPTELARRKAGITIPPMNLRTPKHATKVKVGTVTQEPTFQPSLTSTLSAAGPCDCLGPDLNCEDFNSQEDAQACWEYCGSLGIDNPFGLDNNADQIACNINPTATP